MNSGIATKTLAEVYLSQGYPRKAMEIYHEILKREPLNAEIREAIERLKGQMAHSQTQPTNRYAGLTRVERIRTLERWREKIQTIQRQRRNRKRLEEETVQIRRESSRQQGS